MASRGRGGLPAARARDRVRSGFRRLTPGTARQQPAPVPVAPADAAARDQDRARLAAERRRLERAYRRLERRVLGAAPGTPAGAGFDPGRADLVVEQATRQAALAVLADRVTRGETLRQAYVATLRRLLERRTHRHAARALALGMAEQTGDAGLRHLGLGLVLHDMALFDLAWAQLRKLDGDTLVEAAPVEAVQCALAAGGSRADEVVSDVLAAAERLPAPALVDLAGRLLCVGDLDAARRLLAEADRREAGALGAHAAKAAANLRRWAHPAGPEPPPPGAVVVGVIDYNQPDFDRASRNVGDYVQTLAMLGSLARFQRASFTGAGGLGELMSSLQARVKPTLRLDGLESRVHLVPVSRDFSRGDPVPESTWMVAFGWHLHSTFRLRFGLPYHPHINPVFVSFHVNRPQALTQETLAYLREHGPVGCRDWTTVDLLLSAGVDAFFTGCLTSTVDAVFPDRSQVEREVPGVVAVVDLPASAVRRARRPVETVTHGDARYRELDLEDGTRAAMDLLTEYQRRYHRVVTSRLHSYLPATSLGVPVTFLPKTPGDVRFDGLLGMTPDAPEFTRMRDGIRVLLAEVFSRVLAGAPREEVYARWRELTADRVAEARRRHAAPVAMRVEVGVPRLVAPVRDGMRPYGPHESVDEPAVTNVALSLDANFKRLLPVTLESLVTNAQGPLRLWVTTRGLGDAYEAWVAAAFPDVPITFLECDHVDYGEVGRMIPHTSVATMDRLLLPEVLPQLGRVTYVDIDTVTEADVCELARVDLQGAPLAARTTFSTATTQWRAAGDLLAPQDASELRRTMTARHPFEFATFNAGVLVLDLDRMRKDRFVETFLPMAGQWGLNDQDLLNAYVGADRVELPTRWNALPALEDVTEPGIVHYAGAGKPWDEELVPYGEVWRRWSARSAARVGAAP